MKNLLMESRTTTVNWSIRTGAMRLTSPAFLHGQTMPLQYSQASLNKNPPLLIEGVPASAKKLVLLMDEEETAGGIFTHWIIFNLDPKTRYISEDCVPSTAQMGANSWGEPFYRGPEQVFGDRQYYFRLYALDRELNLPDAATRMAITEAMKGHVVSEAVLMGRFGAWRRAGAEF